EPLRQRPQLAADLFVEVRVLDVLGQLGRFEELLREGLVVERATDPGPRVTTRPVVPTVLAVVVPSRGAAVTRGAVALVRVAVAAAGTLALVVAAVVTALEAAGVVTTGGA